MASHLGQQAVVIGGSLAGLMAARVLADHFTTVTILERDYIDGRPGLHQSIPQGSHLHALLFGGQQVMAALYPGFVGKLEALGAVRCRAGMEVAFYLPTGKAFSMTGTVREPRDLGFDITCHSRELLEYCVRDCTLRHTNMAFVAESTAQRLLYAAGCVRGVHYTQAGEDHCLPADLVVDAGGRRSQAPHWLTTLGFPAPEVTTIGVDVGYASTKFRMAETYDEPERLLGFIGPPPDVANGALLEIIEQRLWHVTLMGRFGNYPPHDAAGFLAFAKTLHTPKLYELIKDATRVASITAYRFPTSIRHHYERLSTVPEGFVVLGDAVSSVNPFYGQGMSVAAQQAQALQQLLRERADRAQGLDGLAGDFFQAAAIVDRPWSLAAIRDFAYPGTRGERPADLEKQAQYFADVDALTAEDLEVQRLVTEVLNLVKPLSALQDEALRSRVEAHNGRC